MSYLKTRKINMERHLASLLSRNSPKLAVGYAFINNDIYIYKIYENKYSCRLLNKTNWSEEAIFDFLTWEELKQILSTIEFIEKSDLNYWIKSKKNSIILKLIFKIRKLLKLS